MSKSVSKRKSSKPEIILHNFLKKVVSGLSLVLFGGFVLQAADVVSIGKHIFPTAAAQSEKTVDRDLKKISPEAANQIKALMDEKASRTAAQLKIDSNLLYTIKMTRGELVARGVPTLETGLSADANGFIEVKISANVTDNLLERLKNVNAEIKSVFPEYRSILANVPIGEIESLAVMDEVIFISPKPVVMTNRAEPSETDAAPAASPLIAPTNFSSQSETSFGERSVRVRNFLTKTLADDYAPQTGTATSEADITHRAAIARMLTGATGAGLKIGVISDGVRTLAARQASGDLPTVTVLPGQDGAANGGDEGTAMLELIYDLAPGAQLYFATAYDTPEQFATNIKALRTAGCDIIVDDISYLEETPFQNGQAANVVSFYGMGIVVQAVNDVTVGSQAGAFYFSSAGNSGNKNDNTAGAWEGDFVDGGALTVGTTTLAHVHKYSNNDVGNPLTAAGAPYLKWSDPIGASSNDYDLYVLNAARTSVVAVSGNAQNGTQDPIERITTVRAAGEVVLIVKDSGADRFLHLNTNRGRLTTSTPGVTFGHNAGLNTITVGATPAGPAIFTSSIGPFPYAFSSANKVETFSSDGPRRIFYNADGTPITPGDVSATGGQLLQKPNITAADGTTTTTPNFIPFFGTSAAAPHAAAMMALLKSASPTSTNAQLYNAMVSSAIDIEAAGVDRDSGAGIFMPLRAMAALNVSGQAYLDIAAPIAAEPANGNNNGRIDPGETATLNIPLNNVGLADATAVSATLTSSTSGVTILPTQTQSYPNIAKAVGTANNPVPFKFRLANNFPCGGSINFTLTVNYSGGSGTQTFNFTVNTTQTSDVSIVSTTLDATAPPSSPYYTATTGTQTGRLGRSNAAGTAANCNGRKTSPGLLVTTGARRFDAYTYTATYSGCVTVTLTGDSNLLYSVAYNSAGFNPANPNANYLADGSLGVLTYSFNVVAGQTFTVVVHEVDPDGGINANYTLNVSGPIAGGSCLAPVIPPINLTVNKATETNDDGVCNAAGCSLREALDAADSDGAINTITFNIPANSANCVGTNCTITVGSPLAPLADAGNLITIDGAAGANSITLSGGGQFRIMTVVSGTNINLNSLNFTAAAGGNGSAIYVNGGGSVTLADSALYGNSSNSPGGALRCESGCVMNLTNVTLFGNSSPNGGGILNNGSVTATSCTITGNYGGFGGGGVAGGITVRNTIIAGNSSALTNLQDVSGAFTSQGYNLVGKTDGTNGFINGTNGDQTGTNAVPLDARLAPLGNYGGKTLIHALLDGGVIPSPAINAGTSTGAPSTDQRGAIRIGAVDIGAFEVNNTSNGGLFTALLPNCSQNSPYQAQITANNNGFTYSVPNGALPNGITLNTTNNFAPTAIVALSGTPTQTGTFNFAIRATNGANSNTTNYRMLILPPTAAAVSVAGRVIVGERGLMNATVTLTDSNGAARTARTTSFGYYRFDEVAAGQTYIVSVQSKRYQFAPQVVSVVEDLSELNFYSISQ